MKINSRVEFQWNGPEVKVRGKKVVNRSVLGTALIIEGQAIQLCPVKTGRLRGSITIATKGLAGGAGIGNAPLTPPIEEGVAHVGTAVEYGPYVEFGVYGRPGQPFLRPALDLAKGAEVTIIRKNGKAIFGDYLK